MEKIGFIGLGKLGMPCAEAIAKKKYKVCGYDINKVSSKSVRILKSIKNVVEDFHRLKNNKIKEIMVGNLNAKVKETGFTLKT